MGLNKKRDVLLRSGCFSSETFGAQSVAVGIDRLLFFFIFADGLYRLGLFEDLQDFVGSHSEFFR
jgi:hypothetical protein